MNHSRRILVYVTQLMSTGGIESHVSEFCSQLSTKGFSIDLVVRNSQVNSRTKSILTSSCSNLYLINSRDRRLRVIYFFLISLFLSLRRYRAIYVNGQGDSAYFFLKLLKRNRHFILHHHTSGDVEDQSTWSNLYRKAMIAADVVVACSQINGKRIAKFLNRSVEVVPVFSRNLGAKKTIETKSRKIRLGYFGRLIPEKGIEIICRLSLDPECKMIEWHIWGEGSKYDERYFKRESKVHYHGVFQTKEELNEIVEYIDGFVLLSSHPEGLPVSLLEIMSAGLPWLATAQGGIPDIACCKNGTVVIPVDAEYALMKSEILTFATNIASGNIETEKMIDFYKAGFEPGRLIESWTKILFNEPSRLEINNEWYKDQKDLAYPKNK